MAWNDPVSDLRIKISDGPTDRLCATKRVFGEINGTNKTFKTFEFRRVTNFQTCSAPLGVYLNGVLQNISDNIGADYPDTGFFELLTAPSGTDVVEATYYIQYFTDAELQSFLRFSSNVLGYGDDYSSIPGGLQPGAVNFAAAEAYQKLAMRFAERMTDTYRLEDMPDEHRIKIIESLEENANRAREHAMKIRDDFYENRQGMALAPLFGANLGNVSDVPPNR